LGLARLQKDNGKGGVAATRPASLEGFIGPGRKLQRLVI
jgi:hypothetical protein